MTFKWDRDALRMKFDDTMYEALAEARRREVICGCDGEKFYEAPTDDTPFWVHITCGLPSYGCSKMCQVCGKIYVPTYYPDLDEICGDCNGF